MMTRNPIDSVTRAGFNPDNLNWISFEGGARFDYPIHYALALLGARPDTGHIDFLGKWEPGSYCHFHRHVGDTTTLVLEGEHHVIDIADTGTELSHQVRPAGHYAHSLAGNAHMEYAGSEGSLVFFNMQSVDGRLFEVLDQEQKVLGVVTIEDFIAGRLGR